MDFTIHPEIRKVLKLSKPWAAAEVGLNQDEPIKLSFLQLLTETRRSEPSMVTTSTQ